jgi:capsular exopolysaccharide synthesis family protein
MSRIQQILDKAERDNTIHRSRVLETLEAPGVQPDVRAPAVASPPPGLAIEAPLSSMSSMSSTSSTSSTSAVRTVRDTHLDRRLAAAREPNSVAAEQYRALRTRLDHGDAGAAVHVVLVTSPGRDDGKSLTAANLGLAMAQEYRRRVAVVDANLRHPTLHRLFGLPSGPGLSDVLAGRVLLDEALVNLEPHNLTVLPAGTPTPHPAESLGTITMRRAMDTLRARFDAVVMDAPAAAPLADVGILTPLTDCIVLVVRAGVTAKPAVHDSIGALDGAKLLGLVLNDAV